MTSYINTVNVDVTVASQKVHPVNLVLTQEYGEHHHFEIILDYDMYGDDFMSDPVKHIQLIGQSVVMRFSHKNVESDYYLFTGVVTNVKKTGHEGKKGYLALSGSSPTIMLEKGRRMDVYSNKTLRGIFELLLEGVYSEYGKHVAQPVFKNRIDFLMQYNETDWDFLKRIAYLYKENLFYSGVEILFGTYQEWDPVKLMYDREIIDLEFCSRMLPNNAEYYQYVADRDTIIERQSPDKIDNTNDYLDAAEKQNIVLTNKKTPKSYLDTPTYDSTDISEILKREKSRNAAQTISIKGKSKTYKSTIGRLISISMPSLLSKTSNIGTYRVVKSVHRIDENNRYTNEFEAVPASLDTMPVKEPRMPQADSVIGKIRSNEDPLNQGRVQVDFDFARNYNFSWLRVLTPNAGSSDMVAQNRGMVFVPEKGDQVMIGFEYGDPNRPYVMGSLFHGKNGKGGGGNNAEKSIITKSGTSITFNDDAGSITLTDPSGNVVVMDGNKNISITAPENITINGKNMIVNIEEDITYNVSKNITANVTETYTLNTKDEKINAENTNISVSNDYCAEIGNSYNTSADKADHSTSANYNIKSGSNVIISGADEVKLT